MSPCAPTQPYSYCHACSRYAPAIPSYRPSRVLVIDGSVMKLKDGFCPLREPR